MSEEPNLVEVSWGGRKIFLHQAKLDEWHRLKSADKKVEWINSHPEARGENVAVHREGGGSNDLQNPDDLVLVKWSGDKVLLFERKQLDDWYNGSYEDHVDYVETHPEARIS